jgi:hypothetical protein
LLDVLWSIPVPTGPPVTVRADQAFGLALLDLALRLQHVTRVSERLRLIDRGHLERTVDLDLDLAMLTRGQIDTLQARPGEQPPPGPQGTGDGGPPYVWVPIARHRRQDVAPVLVRDSAGEVLPRLTHHDAARRMATGLLRLFRLLLTADPGTELPGHPLHELVRETPRSRWLIEHALLRFVDDGGSDHLRGMSALAGYANLQPVARAATPEASMARARSTDAYVIRARAAEGLRIIFQDDQSFAQLLELTAREYHVVARVPRAGDHAFLSYDAPLLPATRPPRSASRLAKALLPLNREFTVEYAATVPRAVRSYHVTVDVPDEVRVRRFAVSSDADAAAVRGLLNDVEAVRAAHDELAAKKPKLLELELQAIASRLTELGRRRHRDAAEYRAYLARCTGDPDVASAPPSPISAEEVVRRFATGDCSPTVLAAFAGHEGNELRSLAGAFTPDVLGGIANGLRRAEIGRDLTVDNDPRENGGHAQWRSPLTELPAGSLEPVRVSAYLALADESPSLVESVARILLALVLVVYGIGALLAGSPWWLVRTPGEFDARNALSRADAIVAVLLLVPGILVARLDIPQTNTVLGQLRSYQRALAYSALVATTGLAMAVAASPPGRGLVDAARVSFAALILLLAACGLEFAVRRRRRHARVPGSATLPAWLHLELGGRHPRTVVPPDARFEALEGDVTAAPHDRSAVPDDLGPPPVTRLAARAAAGGTWAMEYEVVHATQSPALPATADAAPGAGVHPPPDEALRLAAAGARLEVRTWRSSPDVTTDHELKDAAALGGRPARRKDGWCYRGSAVLKPGFLSDWWRELEVLVSLDPPPWVPTHRDTLMLTRALHRISLAAAEEGLPILALISPAAPARDAVGTTRGDGSGERLRSPSASTVRATIGLHDRAWSRLGFERRLLALASEDGLGLRLGDPRAGGVHGHWFAVAPSQPARYRLRRDELFGHVPARAPSEAMPVTVLGPARMGSNLTLFRWLERSAVGCLGASVAVMQDVAFVNLLLPIAPGWAGEPADRATATLAVAGLGRVASRCGTTTARHVRGALDVRPLTGHLLLAGTPVPCTFETLDRTGMPGQFPLWTAWDLPPGLIGVDDVLRAVTEALDEHVAVDVAYARGRHGEGGRLVGCAKLAVAPAGRPPPSSLPEVLAALAAHAQDAAARRLAGPLGLPAADVRVQVVPRERWLAGPVPGG